MIRFGDGPISKLWFNSIDQLIESFVVFASWLFEQPSSGSGNGRLVLVTVVWFWRRSSAGCRSGTSLSKEDVRKERWVKNKVGYIGVYLAEVCVKATAMFMTSFPIASTATHI